MPSPPPPRSGLALSSPLPRLRSSHSGEPVAPPPEPPAFRNVTNPSKLSASFSACPLDNATLTKFQFYNERVSCWVGSVPCSSLRWRQPLDPALEMRNVSAFRSSILFDFLRHIALKKLHAKGNQKFDLALQSQLVPPPSMTDRGDPSWPRPVPDTASSQDLESRVTSPLMTISFEAPHLAHSARWLHEIRRACSLEWQAMAKRLRRYFNLLKCQHLMLLDETFAFYFYLDGDDMNTSDGLIDYYLAAEAPPLPVSDIADLWPAIKPLSPSRDNSDSLLASTCSAAPARNRINPREDPALHPVPAPSDKITTSKSSLQCGRQKSGYRETKVSASFTVRKPIVRATWHALELDGGGKPHQATPEKRKCQFETLSTTHPHKRSPRPTGFGEGEHRYPVPTVHQRRKSLGESAIIQRAYCVSMQPADFRYLNGRVHHGAAPHHTLFFLDRGRSVCKDAHLPPTSSAESNHSGPGAMAPSSSCTKNHIHVNPSRPNALSGQTTLWLRDIHPLAGSSRNVFVASASSLHPEPPSSIQLVLKRFRRDRRAYLLDEILAYEALGGIQGDVVPICFGVFCLQDQHGGDSDDLFLLLKHFEFPPLSEAPRWWPRELLRRLSAEAEEAVRKIHRAGVLHADLAARNILVNPETQPGVILVDFDLAIVVGPGVASAATGETKSDMAAVRWAFGEGLEL